MVEKETGPYRGSCLCGAVRYEAEEIGSRVAHCHCSMCRKFHGAAFATFGEAQRDRFRWLQGTQYLAAYTADNGTIRRFCKRCGSSLTFETPRDAGDRIDFALGTLDTKIALRPDAHIFVGSKAEWYGISDTLPQYPEGR